MIGSDAVLSCDLAGCALALPMIEVVLEPGVGFAGDDELMVCERVCVGCSSDDDVCDVLGAAVSDTDGVSISDWLCVGCDGNSMDCTTKPDLGGGIVAAGQ